MPKLSKKNDYKKIVFYSLIINTILIIISIIAILQYYPTSITKEINNVTSTSIILAVTRRIQLNSFLSQTDSIFILFWCYAILCYISILIDTIIYLLDKNFNYESKQTLTFSIIPIIIGGVLLTNNYLKIDFLEKIIFKNSSIIITFGISFIILCLGYFQKKKGT